MIKNLSANAGDVGSIPGPRRAPGKGNGNQLQHHCLGNPMDRGAWWATVHGVTKSWTQNKNQSLIVKKKKKSAYKFGNCLPCIVIPAVFLTFWKTVSIDISSNTSFRNKIDSKG